MHASCFHPATPYLAETAQRTPQKCSAHPISSWVYTASKGWGMREPELTLMPSVTGRVLLEAVQRGTGAHLISCCLDWHVLPCPLSAWVLLQKGGGDYSMLMSILLLLHIKTGIDVGLAFSWQCETLTGFPSKTLFLLCSHHTHKTNEKTPPLNNKRYTRLRKLGKLRWTIAFWKICVNSWKNKAF